MNIYEYFDEHWVQAFFWGFACFCVATGIPYTIRRILRYLTVMLRGWPPSHLDADGDWKPEAKTAPTRAKQ